MVTLSSVPVHSRCSAPFVEEGTMERKDWGRKNGIEKAIASKSLFIVTC